MVGVGGTFKFKFQTGKLKTGSSNLEFAYKQPWEGGSTGETKILKLNVISEFGSEKFQSTLEGNIVNINLVILSIYILSFFLV